MLSNCGSPAGGARRRSRSSRTSDAMPRSRAIAADGSEVLKLWFVSTDDYRPAELKSLLGEHLKAFKKAFAAEKPASA